MNIKKFLTLSLIASIMSSLSCAEVNKGGFYAGGNVGLNISHIDVCKEGENDRSGKKNKFLGEIFFGYDYQLNKAMLGIEILGGVEFGKTKKSFDKTSDRLKLDYKIGKSWNIGVMPRIGFLIASRGELYVTGGIKISHWKFNINQQEFAAEGYSAKKTKIYPVVGAGVRFDFMPNVFGKLEYNYEFKKSMKAPETKFTDGNDTVFTSGKLRGNIIKLGVGFRF